MPAPPRWARSSAPRCREGPLNSLIVNGIIAGVGGVIVFLPQILILFAFILALEESGYLPRAAFLLDRLMAAAGLSGRSFIPLLSSFACAIPGIMATRTIQDPRDRLATIIVAPLMTCSARLAGVRAADQRLHPATAGRRLFNLQGLVLFALYAAGILSALLVAWVMKKWRRDKSEHALMLELPSYRMPHPRDLALGLWERAAIFLKRVGGIILALTILLWFLLNFPGAPAGATGPAIDYSLAGRIGHAMTSVFAPIGFNWQICIALIPGLAAREVAVSSLATVYALSAADDAAAAQALSPLIIQDWSLATALSLLVWYIYAPHVPFHAGDDQARDAFLEAGRDQRGLPVRTGLPGVVHHLPGRSGNGGWMMDARPACAIRSDRAGGAHSASASLPRRQFPAGVRRLRIACAVPLLREGRSPWLQRLGRWMAPEPRNARRRLWRLQQL